MNRKLLFAWFALTVISSLSLFGCGASTSDTTTTTTSSTTSTTVAPVASITGTITLPGIAGHLWFGATTDSTVTTTEGWSEDSVQVAASDTSYDYIIPISASGTYYVVAQLSVGTTSLNSPPQSGDRLGEYADGGLPSSYGQTPVGSPTPIVVTSGAQTGKNFELKVTWR